MLILLGWGTLIAGVGFALTWAACVRVKNYGFLDVAFSYGLAVLLPLYAWLGPVFGLRQALFGIVGLAWSLRLGTYILRRVLRHHPNEDVRYEKLRQRWPGPGMFLLFFELQAVLVVIFSLPFLFAAFNPQRSLHALEVVGLLVAALGLAGESLADHQMQAFKSNPARQGAVCDVGLWRYSRHPNYFFESVVWWGFSFAALGSPWGGLALVCPLLMLYFLFKVTGIPLTEEYALKSKGDAYRRYQQTTSAFVPWFRKTP